MEHSGAYAQLLISVESGNDAQAEDVCRAALARGEDWQFWETQLGYVCFSNDKDAVSFLEQLIKFWVF